MKDEEKEEEEEENEPTFRWSKTFRTTTATNRASRRRYRCRLSSKATVISLGFLFEAVAAHERREERESDAAGRVAARSPLTYTTKNVADAQRSGRPMTTTTAGANGASFQPPFPREQSKKDRPLCSQSYSCSLSRDDEDASTGCLLLWRERRRRQTETTTTTKAWERTPRCRQRRK